MAYENLLAFMASGWFTLLLVLLIIWEAVWKGISLWKAGRNDHLVWFVFLFILNTAGILPIIYLLIYRKRRKKSKK